MSMDVPVRAEVWCTDGLCGRSDELIVNPAPQQVTHVIVTEEQRPHAEFVSRNEPVDAVLTAFTQKPHLEAILITETGKKLEKLLGIATRWDLPKADRRR
jgi:hypothetical protein